MTGILKVDQWKDSGDNALMTSDGAGNLTANVSIAGFSSTGIDDNATSTAMTINSSQNVGIGTSSPTTRLEVKDNNVNNYSTGITLSQGYNSVVSKISSNFGGTMTISAGESTGTATMVFKTNATEAMRINSSGDVLIGTTSTNNNERVRIKNGNDTRAIAFQSASSNECGYIYINSGGTSVTYSTSSDYRLKENVVDLTDASTRVKQLQPKRFNFIADANTTVDGFLAHEVSDIVPEAITGTKDELDEEGNPVYQGIDQSKLVPLLTASLQEAIAKIEELETRIAALENA